MASELDYKIEHTLRTYLETVTPAIEFLGEERGGADPTSSTTWVVDPIDGTANFIHGLPLCGTSIALVHNGRPVLGVISLPFLKERYWATENGGAWYQYALPRHGQAAHDEWQPRHKLSASFTTKLEDAVVAIGDYAVGRNSANKNRVRFSLTQSLAKRVQRIRMLGSAATDLAWVAAGRLDASIILSNKPWDMAAGVIIAREAGAQVIDADGAQHTFESQATITTTPELARHITEIITIVEAHV